MPNRRTFLKGAMAAVAGVTVIGNRSGAAAESVAYPANIVYTRDNPGIWEAKVNSHAPEVSVEGRNVGIFTKHGMSDEHFIVRHTLVDKEGQVLGSKTFSPSDDEARSSFALPEGYKGKLYATSFCNKHDLWLTEVTV